MLLPACSSAPKPPPKDPEPPPLCSYATRSEGLSAESRTLAIATWFSFLLPGYKLASGEVTRPITNCTGQTVRWVYPNSGASDCPDLEADLAYLPPVPVKPEDLVLSSTSKLERLVWAGADRLSDGQVEGPVVLAEFTDKSVDVRAIGTLRALPGRGKLRIVTIKERVEDRHLLVAEGEYCPPGGAVGKCFRGTRIMLVKGQRFEPQPLRREDGSCADPAFFPMARVQTVKARDGSKQQVKLSCKLEFAPDRVLVHEEVEVRALEAGAPGALLRLAQADRVIRVRAGKLYASDVSLWNRMLHEDK